MITIKTATQLYNTITNNYDKTDEVSGGMFRVASFPF